ncbi:GNAT family N-acetyltransferase [Bradyrhizobium sp. Ai1a-2]|uniref:GNAT family N-acetyltransferase n=1 Tax=Bradyrhizobium sp. Ai1a-2 TaxID=196490 RepID=UPI0031B8110E
MDYYLGDMRKDMPAQDGRSRAVSTDVADTIEGLMPSLMDIFAGSDEVVRFEPVGPEDEPAAQQETDYVNHVFMQQNPGFMILYSFIKDALLSPPGCLGRSGSASRRPLPSERQVIGGNSQMYRIREVDGQDEDVADTLAELHQLTFFDRARVPAFDQGHWWLAFDGAEPVAFAGLVSSTHVDNAGYFCRVGVLRQHCGRCLQLRLMRALETRARRNGWHSIVSDTTDNIASANNFIRAGYRLYEPEAPWAWPHTLYWRKTMG